MFKPGGRKILSLGGVVLVLLAAGFYYVATDFLDPFERAPRHQDMNDPAFRKVVASLTGLTFPASTRWRGVHLDQWQDSTFIGSCEIPKGEIPTMLPGKKIDWRAANKAIFSSDYQAPWFDPDSVIKYRFAELDHPNENSVLQILYDDSVDSGTMARVYIIWSNC